MCLPSTLPSPCGKFQRSLNFLDILIHSLVVFSVFKYISLRILIIAAATCSTMYGTAFLLIRISNGFTTRKISESYATQFFWFYALSHNSILL